MSLGKAIAAMGADERNRAEFGMAAAVVFLIALMIMPVPTFLLDILLACSISLSLVVLLIAFNSVRPLDFSAFPALLMFLTLFRLGLNLRSTTLILGEGEAGSVIAAFGTFVIGGNYVVGVILFLILVAINFIVLTKGSGRVAEVAARFTLDSIPGRQMAIDADLSNGYITQDEARDRREQVSREADFFGAMDGASKFVKGDAIAGLLITGINLLGGIFIGMVQRGMSFSAAVSTYSILTVGDGLVSQVPALIVSVAAGLMVTKTSGDEGTAGALLRQLSSQPRSLWVASGFMGLVGVVPGFPALPFFAMAGGTAFFAYRLGNAEHAVAAADAKTAEEKAAAALAVPVDAMEELLQVNPIELEIGYSLISLADEKQGGDLPDRIRLMRKQFGASLGLLLPEVTIIDDIRLPATEYVLKLRGAEVARGEVMPRFFLALDTGGVEQTIEGMETVDPAHGLPGRWIAKTRRVEAESYGYVVVEPTTVIATHMVEVLKRHGADLLGRQEVQAMVDTLRRSHPALVTEVMGTDKAPGKLSLGTLHRVLQRLLREQVPIRDLVTILEALGDAADQGESKPEVLVEHARRSLSHVIGKLYTDPDGELRAVTIGENLAGQLMRMWGGKDSALLRDSEALGEVLRGLHELVQEHAVEGRSLPLLVPGRLRAGVRDLIDPVLPSVPVIAFEELPSQVSPKYVDTWEFSHAI